MIPYHRSFSRIHPLVHCFTSILIPAQIVCSFALLFPRLAAEEPKPKTIHARLNVAHRGASFTAPENTLAAYHAAIVAKADGAECDVYRSADGILFLSHDRTPKRTMGGSSEDLTKMTIGQIQQFDAGSWKGKNWEGRTFQGERVPTLDEYLKVLKGTPCHPVIEIKMSEIEADVLEVIHQNEMIDASTIIAFDADVVREIRRLEPTICVAWLYSENLKNKGTAEENADRLAKLLIERCRELDISIIDLAHGLLSEKLVQALHAADIHVWTWTVNDVVAMNQYLDWGVNSITTDKPELLSELLRVRNVSHGGASSGFIIIDPYDTKSTESSP